MIIVCMGAGYVGGPTMATIADRCPDITVHVFDVSVDRIAAWNSDSLPIYEPGLHEVVMRTRGKNLFFTTDDSCIVKGDLIFISVNTPTKMYGSGAGKAANLTFVEKCSQLIASKILSGHKVIVEKSTVPVRCSVAIRKILGSHHHEGATFSILSNPEFLAEGTAMTDLAEPDRVLIGGESGAQGEAAMECLASVYRRWVPEDRIIRTNCWSSELAKLVANAFLAQRISSINAISAVCDVTGANIEEVGRAVGRDHRIGPKFLQPSVGFGGSCFQKDILNLIYLAETLHLPEVAEYWGGVIAMNDYQRRRFTETIVRSMFNTVDGKHVAIFGFAFKKDTGDTRETSAAVVCASLLEEGARLRIYDPKVPTATIRSDLTERCTTARSQQMLTGNVTICESAMEASRGANAIVILTEWDEFCGAQCDYEAHYRQMIRPSFLFDGRLVTDPQALSRIGFDVYCIGKPTKLKNTEFLYDTA